MDFKAVVTGKMRDFIGINTGSINDAFGFNGAEICFNGGNFAVFINKTGYAAVADNFRTVLHGALGKTQRSFKRPANTGSRRPQCGNGSGKVRLFSQHFFTA